MQPPNSVFDRGGLSLLEWLDELRDYAQAIRPIRTESCEVNETTDGTEILPNLPDAVAGTAAKLFTPFQLIQGSYDGDGVLQPAPSGNLNQFVLFQGSYLRADATQTTSTNMTDSMTALALADGDMIVLQLDATDDGSDLQEASIAQNPSDFDGSNLITFGGSGTSDDPYIWNQSFCLLAQVFAADSSGLPVKGGIVYTVDAQTPPTKIEVVQQTFDNLSLRGVLASGRYGLMAFPDAAPLLS